jgi:hypothetical protein
MGKVNEQQKKYADRLNAALERASEDHDNPTVIVGGDDEHAGLAFYRWAADIIASIIEDEKGNAQAGGESPESALSHAFVGVLQLGLTVGYSLAQMDAENSAVGGSVHDGEG